MTNLLRIVATIDLAVVIAGGVGRLSAQSGYDLFQKAVTAIR